MHAMRSLPARLSPERPKTSENQLKSRIEIDPPAIAHRPDFRGGVR
jgi:hypothetical protein